MLKFYNLIVSCEGMSQLDGKTVQAIYNQKPELFAQKPVRLKKNIFV